MAEGGLFRRGDAGSAAFRALFAAASDGMALLDGAGAIVAANPALARLAGPTLALRPGLPAARLIAVADRPALALLLGAARPTEPLRVAPADPTAPPDAEWSLTLEPLPAQDRLLLRIIDRSAERRAEARLAGSARLETIGRLAGGIAHDFNNLLTAILGGADALRSGGLATATAAAAELAGIEDAARRGAALVRQLLAFARQQQLQPRILDLNGAIAGIAPLLRRLLRDRIRLELALEEPGRRVRMDPAQLDQVLLNLAVNARDAMPDGGTLTIATGHATVLGEGQGRGQGGLPPGRYVVLEVRDTGHGIPPEALPRLFEPFFTTRPEQGGTGLGLATVQGIVAQSGGQIAVESRPGAGTCFRIHLPRQDAPADPPPPLHPLPPAAVIDGPILLVEDEPPLRRLAERVLARAGHAVLPAEDAEAALALLRDAPRPALLLSDVAMPGMDGLALARLLRGRWPGLPVVLVSGYAEAALRADLAAEGFHFLAKPYAPAELLAALDAALQPVGALA